MRPHRRTGPLQHVLLGACLDELPDVQRLLDGLPATAYGQVWIEVPARRPGRPGTEPDALLPRRPERVSVHLLTTAVVPGERAADALRAGCAEWCPGPAQSDRRLSVWAGESVRAHLAPVDAVEPG